MSHGQKYISVNQTNVNKSCSDGNLQVGVQYTYVIPGLYRMKAEG